MSTCRKYNLSLSLIYQSMAQIQTLFEKKWEIIVGNCDTMLFLGGIDPSTVKLISERLGKQTINTINTSRTTGNKGSGSKSRQSIGRNLMFTSEIEQMDNDKCIVFIRSKKPYMDFKYPLESHPNYKKSGDFSDKNMFFLTDEIAFDRKAMLEMTILLKRQKDYIHPKHILQCDDAEEMVPSSETQEKNKIRPLGDILNFIQDKSSINNLITLCEGYDGIKTNQ